MTAMPFGKYRGCLVRELPDGYLAWLSSLSNLREPLRSVIAEECARRSGRLPDSRVAEDLIAAGQRALARRHHPDAGGTHDAMLAIRHAADWLFAKVAGELRRAAA
jgi:hypothetical protein